LVFAAQDEPEAMRLMRDYVATPFDKRREWLRAHSVPPVAKNATGA